MGEPDMMKSWMNLGDGAGAGFRLTPSRPVAPPKEANPWWWHPGQAGVTGGPTDFEAKLASVDPELAITWNAYSSHFTIWMKNPKNRYGWTLLFHVHRRPDERDLARLYTASARRWGRAKDYFLAIEREMERDKASRERKDKQDTMDQAMEHFDHAQIKVGYGPSNGSKFSTYHSGL